MWIGMDLLVSALPALHAIRPRITASTEPDRIYGRVAGRFKFAVFAFTLLNLSSLTNKN